MVGLVAVDGVLGQCPLSPSVDAADTVDVEVNIQVDETATLDLVGVTRLFQVFLAIVPSTDAEGLESGDTEGLDGTGGVSVREREPPHVCAAAVVLWTDIFCLKCGKRHLITSEEGTALAVGIVLPRAATKVLDLVKVFL